MGGLQGGGVGKGAPAGASRFGDFNLGLTGCEAEEFSQVRSP